MRGRHGVDVRVPFVGRAEELRQLETLLDAHAYVELIGPGGVGKSRLALEAAQRAEARGSGETVFIPLAGVAADAIPGTVADALGIRLEPGVSSLEALSNAWERGTGAIVLDNCEDAVETVHAVIERLRSREGAAILATSRTPLHVDGGVSIEVMPFGAADGSQFFAARARLANVEVDLHGKDAAAVSTIVKRLDGLAVAIDLAAARLASLSVEALKDELANPRPLHFRFATSREPRHRTLNRVLDWTLAKLDDETRLVFALAGRFSTLLCAEDLAALTGPTVRTTEAILEELASQSLLVRTPDPKHYGMLAPIRAVARRRFERLAERRTYDERFAGRICAIATALKEWTDDERAAAAMNEISRRYDDYTSVLTWALQEPQERLAMVLDVFSGLGLLWTDGGRWTDGLRWSERFVAACGVLEPLQRGRVQYLALRVAYAACDYDRMLALGSQLVTTFTVGGDRLGLARAYNGLAVASTYTGHFTEAKTYADTSLALYRAIGHDVGIASALINQGAIALEGQRDPVTARACYAEALELATRSRKDATMALAYGNLAEVAYAVHDDVATEQNARLALDYLRRIGDEGRTVWPMHSLARANVMRYEFSGDRAHLEAAAKDLDEAFAIVERLPQPDYFALCLETAARVLFNQQQFESAAELAFIAQRVRRERRVPAFGFTLQQGREELARIESRLSPEAFQEALRRSEAIPLSEAASQARSLLSGASATLPSQPGS